MASPRVLTVVWPCFFRDGAALATMVIGTGELQSSQGNTQTLGAASSGALLHHVGAQATLQLFIQ